KLAIPAIVKGIVHNAGQTCTAGSRLLVQKGIYADFMQAVAQEFSKVRAGTPEMDLTCGPVVNRAQFERVNRYIAKGLADGLKVVAEGSIAEGVPAGGFYVKPTLFSAATHDSDLFTQEIFGPVLVALPFDDEEQAIALANATDYGLLGAVWTENGGRQQRVARGIKVGQVYINGFGAGGGVELPFGGVKKSGHGREKGFIALEEMSTTKTIIQYYGK
ncbi:aldehyde dehydrogenase family protein, partial [Bordetella hinzii]|nr:aldehyde dehydrogenase family protein [Bordetella hinzii]